jgi:hypothetical protein
MLTVIENVINPDQVLQFSQALNNGNWQDGKQSAGVNISSNWMTALTWLVRQAMLLLPGLALSHCLCRWLCPVNLPTQI